MIYYFEINPQILHENLEGEVIIINLTSGIYFSMNAVGGYIWALIEKKQSFDVIIKTLAENYQEETLVIQKAVQKFVDELEKQGLITRISVKPSEPDVIESIIPKNPGNFVAPILEHYQDMQEMLLLDPIHDVDEITGWPHQKQESK